MNAHNQVRRAVRHLPWFRISHIRDFPWRGNSRNMADAEHGKCGTMGDVTLSQKTHHENLFDLAVFSN